MKKNKIKKTKDKKGNNNFIDNYKKCWNFLKESKNFFYLSIIIFIGFIIIGFIFPYFFEDLIKKYLEQLLLKIQGKNIIQLTSFIFFNNLKASLFSLVFGIFFGIFPIIILISNGYFAGVVFRKAVSQAGLGIMWRVLPHGIFEIPAFIISASLGIKIGFEIFKKGRKFKKNIKEAFRFFVLVIIPLLIIAAIIEGSLIYFIK
jgi:stage II sporulation protein M